MHCKGVNLRGLVTQERTKELFKKRKNEYIKLARSTKIVGNNIQLKKEKSIKKEREEGRERGAILCDRDESCGVW